MGDGQRQAPFGAVNSFETQILTNDFNVYASQEQDKRQCDRLRQIGTGDTCTHLYMYVRVRIPLSLSLSLCVCVCVCVCVGACAALACVCTSKSVRVCVFKRCQREGRVCICVWTYIHKLLGVTSFYSAKCIHTYIHTYIRTYIYDHIHHCAHKYIHTDEHARAHAHTHTHTHTNGFQQYIESFMYTCI